MLLKSHASLTCFRASFLPGRAKDLSAPRYEKTLKDKFIQNEMQIGKASGKTVRSSEEGAKEEAL